MVLGLTGGIGSGKSTVARLFEILGYPVFNSDKVAKDVYFENETRQKVIQLLGSAAYLNDSSINKKYISDKIFSNTEILHALNAIIHPAVKQQFLKFLEHHPNKTVIKETALLFEIGIETQMDKIILVVSDDELRINRVMNRDGISRTEVLNKIKSQLPQEDKIKKSDFVITNNETEFLITQVLSIKEQLGC